MKEHVEKLIQQFTDVSNDSKELLNSMIDTISKKKIPDANTVKQMSETIESLKDKYDMVVQYAGTILNDEEIVEFGSPISTYYEAILNSNAMKCQSKLFEMQDLLNDFISVRALTTQYGDALLPFQDNAKSIVERIHTNDIDYDTITHETAGLELFMRALSIDDFSSPEWFEIAPQVTTAYSSSPLVYTGLSLRQYVLEKKGEFNDKTTNSDSEIAEKKPMKQKESQSAKVNEDDETCNIESTYEYNEKKFKLIPKEIEATNSEFVADLKRMGIISHTISNKNEVEEVLSQADDKKISSTIFINDIRKGDTIIASKILKLLASEPGCTIEYMEKILRKPLDTILITIDYLFRKGYIRKYITKYGELLCASPRFSKAVSYKEASKFISVKQKSLDNYDTPKKDDINDIACRIAYCNLFTTLGENDKQDINVIVHNGILFAIFQNDVSNKTSICLGVFNPINADWNEFEQDIYTIFDPTSHNCDSIVFASYEKPLVNAFYDAFTVNYSFDIPPNILGYSLNNGELFVLNEGVSRIEHDTIDEHEATIDNIINREEQENIPSIDDDENKADSKKSEATEIKEEGYVEKLLASDMYYAAITYAKADSIDGINPKLYTQLAYALNDPSTTCIYTSDSLYNLIEDNNSLENALVISTALRTFFSNQMKYDYNIKSTYNAIKDYSLLNTVPAVKEVMYDLAEFKDKYKAGIDAYADYRKKNHTDLENEIKVIKSEANEFYNKNVVGIKKERTGHKRFIETTKAMFSASSELGECIKFVSNGETDAVEIIGEVLKTNFFDSESLVTPDTISEEMLWRYIQKHWDAAGEKMAIRKREDLKHHLKNNIIICTTKAIRILARWYNVMTQAGMDEEDEGVTAYKKLRKSFICNSESAISQIKKIIETTNPDISELAGLKVLIHTLDEMKCCIEGSYPELNKRFLYVNFLLTDDVVLDENYLPDFEQHSPQLEGITMQNRVISHVNKMKRAIPSFKSRLSEILDERGDDYGSAKLIVDYLSISNPGEDYAQYYETIQSGEAYAKETAELRKTNFIGEIELAQSYGQLNNTTEDQKEIIITTIDDWYEWAVGNSNYGFFKKVIDEYMLEIHRNAKIREKDLFEELEAYKTTASTELAIEEKEKKIAKILEAINNQNYTIAEDLLSRNDISDLSSQSIIEEDFLKDFIENYDDFYQPVASKTASLAHLVSSRTRNKEERGAKRLVDNWLPGGSRIGTVRLKTLLNNLGFDVKDITEKNTVGRFEEYIVRTENMFKNQRNSYSHPVAALGSGGSEAGIRVVCLNGAYDTDGLIDIMKTIGNAKNTIILLDYALSLRERRKLARKTKNALGDKLFAVVDRTVMMYLIRNYDETRVNRMLVSLVVPFAYYQPYVWESANYMPPEIFMGRKFELERIKSPTGVNIVYGGRQLGKSALLKKAKDDIDGNENGDRAVYIDIKGLNYMETARKISHELYDQGILSDDVSITDWDRLTRIIKKRLQSEEDSIPYLLLLLDEADAFIESCSKVNYKPFDSLKELQNIGVGRFKFVVAGLRDIVRFKRDALKNNSVLTHLEPMTVTPFKFSEARELMEIPLHYLGVRFPKDKESLMTLIMATTNYFPGLIQMYCAKLVDAMRKKDYAGYDEVDSPPYELSEEHIKKVLSDPEFMQQIREKYEITLKLDEDNYYHIIALAMAWLYHNKGTNKSYSAEDILSVGTCLGISKLADLDSNKLENFMEELKELNVLRMTEEHKYKFTRLTFFQLMGTSDEVDSSLLEYMEM